MSIPYSTIPVAKQSSLWGKPWAVRLECVNSTSSKWWEATCVGGTGCTIGWGKIGTIGQHQYGILEPDGLARAEEKLKKGYVYGGFSNQQSSPSEQTKATPQELVDRATWRPITIHSFTKMLGTHPPTKLELPDINPTLYQKPVHLYLAANGALWGLSPQENNEFVFARLRAP